MRAIEKVAITFGLFFACIGIYLIISILFINRVFSTSKYAKEISEMEIYAHDIVLDKPSKYEGEYDVINKEIGNFTNTNSTFYIIRLFDKESDIRVSVKYPIKVVKNEFIIDEKNPAVSVNNPNLAGSKLVLVFALIIAYFRIHHLLTANKKHQ